MNVTSGSLYKRCPVLLYTPFAWWDIYLASLWGAYVDGCFMFLEHASAPIKPMGDLHPPTKQ